MNNCEIAPCIVINVHVPKRNLGRKDFFYLFCTFQKIVRMDYTHNTCNT